MMQNYFQIELTAFHDIFFRFQRLYPSLSGYTRNELTFFSANDDAALVAMKESVLELCNSMLTARTKYTDELFVRGDYRELVQLTVLYLGGGGDELLVFHRPGAKHHSRWMSKLLYSLKMVMLRKKIEQDLPRNAIYFKGQAEKMVKFVNFFVLCYVPWWLTAPVAALAPHNDFVLIKTLHEYRVIDSTSADAATTAFFRHGWYLSEENVILAFFSSAVDLDVKIKMVEALKACPATPLPTKRSGNFHGKPPHPKQSDVDLEGDLSQFIGSDSWQFLRVMNIPHSLLETPVRLWDEDPHYKRAKNIVDHLLVVNDAAERGVKLAHDFVDAAKSEGKYQNILQVVENSRAEKPDQRSKKVTAKRWFLKL